MAFTVQDIKDRFDEATSGATHMLIVCDTFSYEDYPVYVWANEDVNERILHYSQNMQRVMEVYNLSKPFRGVGREWDTSPFDPKSIKKPTKKKTKKTTAKRKRGTKRGR